MSNEAAVKPLTWRERPNATYIAFVGLALVLLLVGVILCPSWSSFAEGWVRDITHPSLLDFDAIQWGGLGTAFINAGIMLLAVLGVYKLTGTTLGGLHLAAAMMAMGMTFFGKNIVNVWFPLAGAFLHAKLKKKPLKEASAVAWFSTALSPIFSVMAFGTEKLGPGSPLAIILGALFAMLAGFLISVFSAYLPRLHKGRVLYNVGFAAGIAGLIINAAQIALGIGHERYPYEAGDYVSGNNVQLALLLFICFAYLIVAGIVLGGLRPYKDVFWKRCFGGNFVQEHGLGASLINMGVVGCICIVYVFATVTGQFCGPVFACIWTAVGFAAAGVTPRVFAPILAGVYVMSFITGGVSGVLSGQAFLTAAMNKVGMRGMLMAAFFGCGLAPVSGTFGWFAGMFVGGMHSIIVPHTGALHGWMSLYNHGFCTGLIALFLYPLYSKLRIGDKSKCVGPIDDE